MYKALSSLYFSTCFCCGSFFVKNHFFCDSCFATKINNKLSLRSNIYIPSHSYLIKWVPEESDLLSNYIYALKGIKGKRAWIFYAKLISEQLKSQYDLIIPIPSQKRFSKHAHFFAESVAEHLGVPYLVILRRAGANKYQKTLRKDDRKEVEFQRSEHFTTVDLTQKRVLLVDDILTTGSSFKAAQLSLGPTVATDLITLFYRELKRPV